MYYQKYVFKTNIRAHASHTMFLNIVSVSSLSCCENKQMRKKNKTENKLVVIRGEGVWGEGEIHEGSQMYGDG